MSFCEYPSKIGGMQVEQLICLEIVSLRSIRESSMLSHGQCLVQPSIKSMFQMLTLEVVFNNIKNLTHHKSLGIPCYVFFLQIASKLCHALIRNVVPWVK